MSLLFQSDDLFYVLQIRRSPISQWSLYSAYASFAEAEKSAKKLLSEQSGIQLRIMDTEPFQDQTDTMRDWYAPRIY